MNRISLATELSATTYPGRGIVIGRSADGKYAVTAYFIMGRSVNSRNRVFVEDGEGIRTDELIRTSAEILHVTPFNSFPSGVTASAKRRQVYLEWAYQRNAVIIEDDYDSEYTLNGTAPQTLFAQSENDHVIYINTFSKTIAPSLRVAYMLLPEKLLPLYEQTVGFYSCTVPMLEQFFLAEWLDSGEFERTINRVRNTKKI